MEDPPPYHVDRPGFGEARLEEIERYAREDLKGNLGQQAAARRILDLVAEVRRLQLDAARLHFHHMRQEPDVQARALLELQAAMDKYGFSREDVRPELRGPLEQARNPCGCRVCQEFDSTLPKPEAKTDSGGLQS